MKNIETLFPVLPMQEVVLLAGDDAMAVRERRGQLTLPLEGSLDTGSLTAAWRSVVAQDTALRTSFVWRRVEKPLQVVHRSVEAALEEVDWTGSAAGEHEQLLERWLAADRERGFDLTKAPLVRLTLLRMRPERTLLVCTYHRLALDAWSARLVVRRLLADYRERCHGLAAQTPENGCSYRDYVAWLKRQDLAEAEAFWRQVLEGSRGAALSNKAPGTHPTRAMLPARRETPLPPGLSTALQRLACEHGLRHETLFEAAWALMLHRYSQESDLVFGISILGRPSELAGAVRLVGPFANELPLRVQVPAQGDLLPWMRGLQELRAAAARFPFPALEQIRAWSGLAADTPLMASTIEVEEPGLDGVFPWDGLRVGVTEVAEEGGPPLVLRVTSGPALRLDFDPGHFDDTTVDGMLGLVLAILEGMAADPAARLENLPQVAPHELERLTAWNRSATSYPREATIHGLFEEQAALRPEAVALEFGLSLSYGELNRRANRLARHLRSLGVGPEVRVGLFLERSTDLVAGMLAILKAGGTYVPLDTSYPPERLAFLLEDSAVPVVLTWARLRGALPDHRAEVVELGGDLPEALASCTEDDPESWTGPGHTAYFIYTSGSTGRPKGVAVPHRAVIRLVRDTDYVELKPEDRVAQASNASFDAATFEIWGALLNGARLQGIPRDVTLSPPDFAARLRADGITTLFLTTALFNQIATEAPQAFGPLRHVLFGGEAVDPRRVRKILAGGAPPQRLLHVYGPTETTTFASWYLVRGVEEGAWTVPIGGPIANTTLHLVDSRYDRVPLGVAGDLCIGGDGLAWGYAGRPELTAEKFVPDPLSGEPGARLYRTGDLGRWRAEGSIEFLGRRDNQIKLRGFRIELEEIESALVQLPSVAHAVVMVREDQPGERRLVAYVVPAAGGTSVAELRAALQEKLPDYMVPASFVYLERLPLTPNGKVDRRALPPPASEEAADEAGDAPRTVVEEVVGAIWATVLGRERVGAHEDFFDLGGHSLLATQVISRVREAFRVEVPLRALFEEPTVAGLAMAVEAALQERQGLAVPAIARVPRTGELPLSFAQQRLWFLDRLEPGSAAYNMPLAFRIEGRLQTSALAASLTGVVRRHESLRTTFDEAGERPLQRIAPPAPVPLPVVDLRSLPAARRKDETHRLAGREARRPFDLAHGPVLRATLLQTAEDEHVVLFTLHHIAGDGWSMGVLVREVTALYRSFLTGAPPALPELPVQYADFAAWQRSWLEGEALDAELDYWHRQLADVPPVLELPTDRPRPVVQRYRGGSVVLPLGEDLSWEILAAGRREASTPFMTLLAAFQLLLYRSSFQDDLCVGTPIAGRTHLELEGLIGFFVNTLVLRARCAAPVQLRELLQQVRETVLGAYVHQHLPFERLVDELQPERSLSYSPLFQVMFALQNAPVPDLDLPGARLRSFGGARAGTSQFDLSLDVGETEGRFILALTYDSDLFDPVTAMRMLRHLEILLGGLTSDPELRLLQVPILAEEERHQVLREWNDSGMAWPWESSYQLVFEAQVARTPDDVAAVCQGESLTYRELNRRANRIAWRLISLGCKPDQVVPLLAERGLDFLSAILGILKAGGAYLPLDPRHPAQRWARVLEGAGAPLAVVAANFAERLDEAVGLLPLELCPRPVTIESLLEPGGEGDPPCRVTLEHLGYSIFTSGSTGLPKGPMVQHRGLLNHIWALVRGLGLTAGERFAQTASQCFDISVWQFLAMPLLGGTVCILPDEVAQDGRLLLEAAERERITVLEIVPSLMRVMLDEMSRRPQRPDLSALRWLIPTGEALPPEVAQRWLLEVPQVPLINAYGPAECADDVSYSVLRNGGDRVTVGRPVGNVRLYVVDPELHLAAIGVPGELCVGGVCVGRGYLNDPGRTAEVFVPDPFAAEPGARLYRTGDRVRSLSDGNLDFLGRIDHQVKIRGFRIEPGEIEAVLAAHPAVREAVVMAREVAPGGRQLVAWVVSNGELPAAAGDLREALRRVLPDYMVPAFFVFLPSLPLSANGKINRRALPSPIVEIGLGERYTPPRTPTEEVLAAAWGEVLGLERIDRTSNFFEIGGHSLLATRVVSRVREAFGVEIPLRTVFEAPTVAALALRIEVERRQQSGLQVPPLVPVAREGNIPLSFAQERLWFLDQLDPGSSAYNMAMAYRFRGRLEVAALDAALGELEQRHEVLRTRYESEGGSPFQVVEPPHRRSGHLVDLALLPGEERERELRRLARNEARRPFDLQRGPVLRTCVVRLAPEDHALFFTIHHIACDGWSQDILAQEVGALYRAFAAGHPALLPELPVQYADYAAWQRSWLEGAVLEAQVDFWRTRLAGAPPVLELPTDRPRPALPSFRGGTVTRLLEPAVAHGVVSRSRTEKATRFMLLLAAFQVLLARLTGQSDIVVGTPVAGRDRLETERLIGFFVNTLVLRGMLAGEEPFSEALRATRDQLLDVYSHQDLPFEKLVDELGVERRLSHTPVFQVMFAHQNTPVTEVDVAGLDLAPLAADTGMAQFDLALSTLELEHGLALTLRYSTDLFDAATVDRLGGYFERLLSAAVADPSMPAADLPLLSPAEREQVLVEWNDTGSPSGGESCLHELFAARAQESPDSLALVAGERELSYGELAGKASRLARHLQSLSVGPEWVVGVCLERSAEMVVTVLAVLEAGGAYLPLDPAHPQARLQRILSDGGASVVVTQESLAERLPWKGPIVILERDRASLARRSARPLRSGVSRANLAYVLFTSGSTGTPKGVAVTHGSAVELVLWARQVFSPEELSGVLAATSLSFDLSVFELFVPLSWGGTVILAGNALDLPALPAAGRVRLINTVPSALAELVRSGGLPDEVRTVNLAGEPLSRSLADRIFATGTVESLWNLYGPSEDTTYSTFAPVERRSTLAPLIGRPIAATRACVVDRRGQPAPLGVAGELWLGGAGLARGYLGRPDLTAERFVPDPFSPEGGERLYRTGDLVRWLPQGELGFLGRLDHQVKVRGFRIELGEIEAALVAHPEVRAAAVLVREDRPGDQRLVAYVVGDAESAGLREHLRGQLPEYMIPSAFMFLEALPLTPNGKVDRKALPAPLQRRGGEAFQAPRTPEEELLAGIWAEILRVERIGARDDFFALGGHSLLATQVLSRLRDAFQVELPLRKLFEASVLEDLATAVAVARREGAGLATPALKRVTRDGDLPLSFAQERLWFLDQLEPGSPAYNIPVALRIEGELRSEVLAAALTEVVRRHEGLSTVFRAREGKPVQVIRLAEAFALSVIDLSALPEAVREEAARLLAGREAMRPFDLAQGPLIRGVSLRLGAADHVMLLTLHHIISDGWSIGVLVREVTELYRALSTGEPPRLPELPVQYGDYALWQRSWLNGEVLEREIAYWREQLAGLPPLLELPTDRPRPPVQSFRGGNCELRLPVELAEGLRSLARREGITLFMMLLAGFQALLSRFSGEDQIAVGTPIAGRNDLATENLIGLFINTLVLRGDLSGLPDFRGLFRQMREVFLGAHAHQEVPFEKLVEELAPERSLAHAPLFQVMLALQNVPEETASLGDLRLRSFARDGGATAKLDLMLALQEQGRELSGALEYSADLFDATTVDRLGESFERLLGAAVADPSLLVADLPLLSVAEREQVLMEWNDTGSPSSGELRLHELFAARAQESPDALALVDGERELSYGELAEKASRLARHLQSLGVSPERVVGVCLERSAEMVVTVLAVLEAGGAYLPLDPAHPEARLQRILTDGGASAVVAQESLAERLPWSGPTVILERDRASLARRSLRRLKSGVSRANLAYVLFTSGSTGTPKGVAVTHGSAVELVLWARQVFSPEDLSGVLAATSLSFDLSVFELFVPLSWGGTVILAGNALDLPALPAAGRVRLINTVPSALAELVRSGGLPDGVRTVNLAGEPLPRSLADRIFATGTVESLWNLYGPSEDTTYSTFAAVERRSALAPRIGRPIAATRAYVVDRRRQPVPPGVAGELWLGGAGLARGYLGRPDLTAERFVPDPFSCLGGARLYRTGDLVRWLPQGELEFLGRVDHQVKVRGFRIELGEIEAALTACPEVREAVVVTREDQSGDKRLVAYVVGGGEATGLREHLRGQLPEYMIPSTFVALEALPLTPNGKVDRKALPAPLQERGGEVLQAPRTPEEELVAGIWSEVLRVERIGVRDDFFALGGHSLLATQVLSRLRDTFQVELPLRKLFEAPVLEDLATAVAVAWRDRAGLATPPLERVARDSDLPLSFAQERLWFLDQLEPGSPAYNIPVALRLEGELRLEILAAALGEVVRRHEGLRTVFRARDGKPVQVIRPAEAFALPVIDLSVLPEPVREQAARVLAGREAMRPFDLAQGPLIRGVSLRLGAADHAVLLTLHHIVSDGWSMGVLVREVTELYRAFSDGEPPRLPELPVQYGDYAVWQRSWLKGEVLEQEIAYWREQLTGLPPLLELPTDRPRPPVQSFRGGNRDLRLPVELAENLRSLARREGITLFMALLAGFQALLARYSGETQIAVGTPIAGRNYLETEHLIGFFINTLVLRGDLAGRPDFRGLFRQMREVFFGAHAHQEVPFEKLVEELAPERSLAHAPLFQVMLVLQNAPEEAMTFENLRLRPLGSFETAAKFDLTLSFQERGRDILGALSYATDLFDGPTLVRFAGHLERVLTAAVSNPEQRVQELPLLGPIEGEQILVEWNDTRCDTSAAALLHEQVEQWAAATPEKMAVVCGREGLDLAELNQRANRLARRLRDLGAGSESRVALFMERSVDLIVGIFATLKTGAAFLVLDPAQPAARSARILLDASPAVLLTREPAGSSLSDIDIPVLWTDRDAGSLRDGEDNLGLQIDLDQVAYVVYTSGSTGRPKGVSIPHKAVLNLLGALERAIYSGSDPSFRVSINSPLYFDGSIKQVIQLAHGRTLCLVPDEIRADPSALSTYLQEERVDVFDCTPAQLRALLDAGWGNGGRRIPRRVLVGGEAIEQALWGRLCTFGETDFFNVYGPSECTVDTTVRRIGTDAPQPVLGQPIANVKTYVLAAGAVPQPVGVPGELWVGGAGLARGYLRSPDLTAERFVPDPFSGEPGARLYRTGDLVRWLPEGEMEFLGRVDHQVKVRGFRIELGEVEAALAAHPEVRAAAVLVWEERPGDKRLAAYVVGDVKAADLREHLSGRLPEYMIPSAFMVLEALPLTPNGKVDRKALPAPLQERGEEALQAPRTPEEELLAGIWAEVLAVERIGVRDDFFALGGHSLLAIQVLSRLRDTFQVELPLRKLFEAPALEDLATAVAVARRDHAGLATPPLVRATRDGDLPLSFAQERLWFLDQLEPGSAAYNIPSFYRLRGRLDRAALEAALAEVVRRHEVLRTTFGSVEGRPLQVIHPAEPSAVPLVDVSGLAEAEMAREVERLLGDEAKQPFDLARGPVFRAVFVRLAGADHLIALTIHHIVSDGWSMDLLMRELGVLYQAFSAGRPSPLPDLPLQYVDFAVWQRSWLRGEVLERQLAFWRNELAGAPPVLLLPSDRPRPALQGTQGATLPFQFPRELSRSLLALSRRLRTTLFMTALAGFQALLSRYAGQDDVVIGTPIAGRSRLETEGLIGLFVNTLALRARPGKAASFEAALHQVRDTVLEATAHQDLPFERLVEALVPVRNLAHTPLFQVMFALQNAPQRPVSPGDLQVDGVAGERGTSPFDLTLSLRGGEEWMGGEAEYSVDLFDRSTISRMMAHLQELLASAVAHPELSPLELPLLAAPERRQLLEEWSQGAGGVGPEACVHDLVRAQAARNPAATAVVADGSTLTYGELVRRAERLAQLLRKAGAGPEERVAVLLERSPDQIVAILGVLMAGAAYVPLDPAYPVERLELMLEDSGVRRVVTRPGLSAPLHLRQAVPVWIDGLEASVGAAGSAAQRVEPWSLAYVIYTSGSTGRPKGVEIENRSLAHYVRVAAKLFDIRPEDRLLQFASISFDTAAEEIFTALSCGAALVLRTEDMLSSVRTFLDACAEMDVTYLDFPSALWNQMVPEMQREGLGLPPAVRGVIVGGERVLADRVAAWREREGARVRLFNSYGPTEATIVAASWEVPAEVSPLRELPIGRPIPGVRAYLLSSRGELVPVGVAGELLLGGAGLARGYQARPDLTAERFVPDPFSGVPGARLYRTGDLVRWLPEGEMEFLGRVDHQVKVRGFRIELGEIEAALTACRGVLQAVVVAREDQPGDKRLVAYVAGDADAAGLREHLRGQLPEYMIPSAFVALEALPLTPSGKVDRKALPAPLQERSGEALQAPRTPEEELIAGIWAEVLRVEHIGVRDDFFALGGHSLLATQVLSRLRDTFQVELPLRKLFEAPVLEGLAAAVAVARRDRAGLATPPLERVAREGDLPLSFAQERLWFLDQLEPGSPAYNIPVALRLEGELRLEILAAALGEVVRRHEGLRTVFRTREGEPVQVIRPAEPFALPVVDLSRLPEPLREEAARFLAGREAMRPFDLAQGPLIRGVSLRLGAADHVMLLTLHHIASDGWSMGVLVREVTELYRALSTGEPPRLPELPVQYGDYAVWQRSWLHGEVLEREIAYWREHLAGLPPLLELPTDRPRPPVQSFRGGTRGLRLSAELAEGLRSLARREGITLFMMLLAGFQALLSRFSGEDQIAVGTPIAGRNDLAMENLIGFFINTLVLRGDLSGLPDFRGLFRQMREVFLGAHAHQEVPFEKLVEELAPERSLAHAPLFQVMLVLQNVPEETASLGGLRLRSFARDGGITAKLDLMLAFEEQGRELSGALEYSADLFDATTVDRLGKSFERLLSAAVADPSLLVADLPLLSTAEREQLLVEWNNTGSPSGGELCLNELFAARAEESPDALALVDGERELSYGELAGKASRLARHLQSLGVGPERVVGVCLERSAEMVVTVLAVLEAGGAYLPLDPAHPEARLQRILTDGGASVVVTQESLAERLPWSGPAVILERDRASLARRSPRRLKSGVSRANLAYVLFTSGSTGTPKGVAVTHGSAVELVLWARQVFSPEDLSGVLAATSLSFDLSVFELFVPLSWGGTVILAGNALDLPGLPAAGRVRLINTVPSALAELVRSGGLPEGVRTVNLAGEPLPRSLADRIWATGTVGSLWNLYGPSEDTTYSTFAALERQSALAPRIGRPIAATRAYVVDRRGQPVPPGVAGELWLGGAGLARGYLGRPDLTAERFVPDPFSSAGGARLYRTGDLVRWLPQGELEFLGRLDHQVKVRGFRIELGEIEAALAAHPEVRAAAVLVWEDQPGDQRLIAYVAGDADANGLREHLRGQLPEYMIPSVFLSLETLPLTPSGKVDRKALPPPGEDRGRQKGTYVPPRDSLELDLVRLWEEVLAFRPVGVRDSFFALGGHSLLAVRLVAGIARRLGRELPLIELFQHPTIESLARSLRAAQPVIQPVSPVVAIQTGGDRRPFFCVHPGGGTVFSYVALSRHLGPQRPFYGLQAPGIQPGDALDDTIEAMAARYVRALREVQPAGPYLLGGWSLGGVTAYEMARQLREAGEEVELLALIDAHAPAPAGAPSEDGDLALLAAFAQDLGVPLEELPVSVADARSMSRQELLAGLVAQALRLGVLTPGVEAGRIEHLFRVFVAHNRARDRYTPGVYDGRVTLYRAAGERPDDDATLGWGRLALDGVDIREVPGTHFTVVREPAVVELADRLAEDLP
jgi:amino acid adenylation domain-containing protein